MSALKLTMMMGASALIASFAGAANAAAPSTDSISMNGSKVTEIYGAGSSLVAPYWRQAADCYGVPTSLIFKGVPPTLVDEAPFNYSSKKVSLDCATEHVNPKAEIVYISTGSGTGIGGIYSHDSSKYGDTNPNKNGDQFFPTVNYALSDASLGATEVSAYNNGGTVKGVTVVAPGETAGSGQYPNPHDLYGALIQFPASIDPVAIVYDPVYEKVRAANGTITSYSFNVQSPRADGSGGLKLDAATYCAIFNGQITDWNDPALKALNGGVSLKDPNDPTSEGSWSVPLQIVGRSESSGTTSIFTRHIANVCASVDGNQYTDAADTLPAGLQGPTYDKSQPNTAVAGETLGKFTRADGSDGVAKYVDFTVDPTSKKGNTVIQGRIAYVGPDYALPAVLNTNANDYNLNTADLKNSSGNYVAPTAAAASAAFGSLTPPQSDAQGHYDAGSSDTRSRANPQDWVEAASKTSALANPTAAAGYPIVGTTNLLAYTCYASPKVRFKFYQYLSWYLGSKVVSDPNHGLLASAGLAPLPKTWIRAISETFVKDKYGLNLNLDVAGHGACSAETVTGG